MEIVLSSISDRGDIFNERVGFKVLKKCQLKYFMVFKTRPTENGFLNVATGAYWFLPQEVNAGDKVVLYTKSGRNSVAENVDGSRTYFFYWGLSSAIFNSEIIVLGSVSDWNIIR